MIRASKRTRQRRGHVRLLDAYARAEVFERDGGRCCRCGSTRNLQWCHVFSRRYKHLRWEPDNSFTGCAGCHLWWHHEPILAVDWFRKSYPDRYERLLRLRNSDARINVRELAEALK